MWGVRVKVQVFKRKFHTHIHLDSVRVKILSYIYLKKKIVKSHDIWLSTTTIVCAS